MNFMIFRGREIIFTNFRRREMIFMIFRLRGNAISGQYFRQEVTV